MAAALCTPDDAWPDATAAGIRPIDASFSEREVPVEHRANGAHTINRAEYSDGVILIPNGHDPTGTPAVLPAVEESGNSVIVTLDPEDVMDFGYGVTIVFT